MKITFSILLCFLFLHSVAQAQPTSNIMGKWSGVTKSPSTGNELLMQVKISEASGTWLYLSHATTRNPCFGREFPLSVETLPNGRVKFSVDGASVITGCPSFAVTLDRIDEKTLSGAFLDGRPAVLKKQ